MGAATRPPRDVELVPVRAEVERLLVAEGAARAGELHEVAEDDPPEHPAPLLVAGLGCLL